MKLSCLRGLFGCKCDGRVALQTELSSLYEGGGCSVGEKK